MLIVFSAAAKASDWRNRQWNRNGLGRDAANLIRDGATLTSAAWQLGHRHGAMIAIMRRACPPFAEPPQKPKGPRLRARIIPLPTDSPDMAKAKEILALVIADIKADRARGQRLPFRMRPTDWGPTKHGIER